MVVAKNNNRPYTYGSYGNTAYDYREYDNNTEKQKVNRANTKHEKRAQFRKQFKLMSTVVLMLCTGMLIVGRYVYVMNLNSQCEKYKTSIAENQKKNDELKLQLMKYGDIKQIEKIATTQLNMTRPDNNNIIFINPDKTDSKDKVAAAGDTQKHEDGIINRIIKFFNW